eukprot:6205631-Pleurochrysis_carterae.AAC.2
MHSSAANNACVPALSRYRAIQPEAPGLNGPAGAAMKACKLRVKEQTSVVGCPLDEGLAIIGVKMLRTFTCQRFLHTAQNKWAKTLRTLCAFCRLARSLARPAISPIAGLSWMAVTHVNKYVEK